MPWSSTSRENRPHTPMFPGPQALPTSPHHPTANAHSPPSLGGSGVHSSPPWIEMIWLFSHGLEKWYTETYPATPCELCTLEFWGKNPHQLKAHHCRYIGLIYLHIYSINDCAWTILVKAHPPLVELSVRYMFFCVIPQFTRSIVRTFYKWLGGLNVCGSYTILYHKGVAKQCMPLKFSHSKLILLCNYHKNRYFPICV